MDKLYFPLPTNPFKNEKGFTAWFGAKIREKGGFWHKISDMSIDSKPCDSIIALDNFVCLCEIKVGNNKNTVNLDSILRPNQSFGLRRYKENGGTGIVVFYSKSNHRYDIVDYEPGLTISLSK